MIVKKKAPAASVKTIWKRATKALRAERRVAKMIPRLFDRASRVAELEAEAMSAQRGLLKAAAYHRRGVISAVRALRAADQVYGPLRADDLALKNAALEFDRAQQHLALARASFLQLQTWEPGTALATVTKLVKPSDSAVAFLHACSKAKAERRPGRPISKAGRFIGATLCEQVQSRAEAA